MIHHYRDFLYEINAGVNKIRLKYFLASLEWFIPSLSMRRNAIEHEVSPSKILAVCFIPSENNSNYTKLPFSAFNDEDHIC
jgi:hypothetical protein